MLCEFSTVFAFRFPLSFDAATQVVVAAAAVIAPGLITNTNTNADAQIPYQRSAIHRKSRCYVEDFGLI